MNWKQVAPGTYTEELTEEERVEEYTLTEDDIRTVVGLSDDIDIEVE